MQEHKISGKRKSQSGRQNVRKKQRSDRKERGWHEIDRLKRYYWKKIWRIKKPCLTEKEKQEVSPDKEKEAKHVEKIEAIEKKAQMEVYQRTCYHFRAGGELEGENGKEEISEHSLRMGNLRVKAKNQSFEKRRVHNGTAVRKSWCRNMPVREKQREKMRSIQKRKREGNRRITLQKICGRRNKSRSDCKKKQDVPQRNFFF